MIPVIPFCAQRSRSYCLIGRDASLIGDVCRDGVLDYLEGEEIREVVARLSRRAGKGDEADLNAVLDEEISAGARKRLSGEIFRAEMSAVDARRIYPDVVLGLRIRKLEREIARLGEAHKAAVAAGDAELSQERFTAQKTARIEKERLMRERRMRI